MGKCRTIIVRKDFDVIVARSYVRELARQVGLLTTDQARISLATSSAARTMKLGEQYKGQIAIESLNGSERVGVRVVCRVNSAASGEVASAKFSDARFMTDELTVEKLPSGGVQVVLVKWATRGGMHA